MYFVFRFSSQDVSTITKEQEFVPDPTDEDLYEEILASGTFLYIYIYIIIEYICIFRAKQALYVYCIYNKIKLTTVIIINLNN